MIATSTATTAVTWLALAAILVHAAVKLLSSSALNSLLSLVGLKPLPTLWLQRLLLGASLAAAFVDSMVSGEDWKTAIATAISALFGAAVGLAVHAAHTPPLMLEQLGEVLSTDKPAAPPAGGAS